MPAPPRLPTKDEAMIPQLRADQAAEQVANVATMPGIVGRSMAMPDIHWGYGFPIGGVAAFDYDEGVFSPGGAGYDLNWGGAPRPDGPHRSRRSAEDPRARRHVLPQRAERGRRGRAREGLPPGPRADHRGWREVGGGKPLRMAR